MNSPEAITVLRTQSLTSLVHEELERRIAAGQLPPGSPLREVAVASDMGISRGPVREAFRMLEERGLVQFEKNVGVRVRKLDLRQAQHLYQVRIPLEALIGELAAEHMPPEIAEEIRQLLADMEEAVARQDVARYTPMNFQFHDLLARGTGNPALHDTYRRLVVQLNLFRSHSFEHKPVTIEGSLREHQTVFDAIEAGDARLAGELLRQHARDSLEKLRAAAQDARADAP